MPALKEIKLPIACDDDALMPTYGHESDAGLDLRTSVDFTLDPGQYKTIPCGISIAIPVGYAGLVIPRSGLASKHGIGIVNSPGLIDSGYRGEVAVILVNHDAHEAFEAKAGDRIAQLLLVEAPHVNLEPSETLQSSDRGNAGFGSTGV